MSAVISTCTVQSGISSSMPRTENLLIFLYTTNYTLTVSSMLLRILTLASSTAFAAAAQIWLPSRDLAESSSVSAILNEDVFVEVGEEVNLDTTTPLFFHIPRTGGSTIQDLVAFCLGVVTASEVGVVDGHDQDDELQLISRDGCRGSMFVNVDTTSIEGIDRASELGFAGSGLAEMVITSFVPQASNALFNEDNRASVFSLFRHPVERAVSLFYYLQDADWEVSCTHESLRFVE